MKESNGEKLDASIQAYAERIRDAKREKLLTLKAELMANDPEYADSAAELLENIKNTDTKKSLLILAGLTPGDEEGKYKKALGEVPEHLRRVADRVMPAVTGLKGNERKLGDWIFLNNAAIDGETGLGIDLDLIPDEFFQERMTASRVAEVVKSTRYDSQREFTEKLSERIRKIRIKRAFEKLRKTPK